MTITRVSKFLASDACEFSNAREANTHENRLELVSWVGEDSLAKIETKYRLVAHRNPRKTPEEKAAIALTEAAAKAARKIEKEEAAKLKAEQAAVTAKAAKNEAKANSQAKAH